MARSKSIFGLTTFFRPRALISCVLLIAITAGAFILKSNSGLVLSQGPASAILLSEISIDRLNGNRVYQNQPFTGEAVTYSNDGVLIQSEQFVNGRRDGHLKKWFPNDVLAFEAFYSVGRRVGMTKSWWSNGNLRSQTEYLDDKPEGVAWSWYRTGEKFKRYNYSDGQPIGLQQAWRLNGTLFSNFEYKNGRIFGLQKANLCVNLEDEEMQLY